MFVCSIWWSAVGCVCVGGREGSLFYVGANMSIANIDKRMAHVLQ